MLILPCGGRQRINGTPAINTKNAAEAAERAHIERVLSGKVSAFGRAPISVVKEVPTIRTYSKIFLESYGPSDKPSAKLARKQIINGYIIKHLGELRLNLVLQKHIDGLVARLLPTLARKTINNITSALSSLLRYAALNHVILADDITGLSFEIKAQAKEVVAVATEGIQKLVDTTKDTRYRVAVLLAADAGLRIGEIRALTWADIDELAREITVCKSSDRSNQVTDTKGWKVRSVPISSRLWKALAALPRQANWIIAHKDADQPLGYDTLREGIHRLYKQAGVTAPSKPWHSLRHSFGTELASAGVPIHTIKEMMGHSSIETTLRYMHTDREARREAIDRLNYRPGTDTAISKEKTLAKHLT